MSAHTALLSLRVPINRKRGEMDFPSAVYKHYFVVARGQCRREPEADLLSLDWYYSSVLNQVTFRGWAVGISNLLRHFHASHSRMVSVQRTVGKKMPKHAGRHGRGRQEGLELTARVAWWGQMRIRESVFASESILHHVVMSSYGPDGCWPLPRRAQRPVAVVLSWG